MTTHKIVTRDFILSFLSHFAISFSFQLLLPTATAVIDLFADLVRQGRTILLVTHDRDVARRGSQVVTLADGTITSAESTAPGDAIMKKSGDKNA